MTFLSGVVTMRDLVLALMDVPADATLVLSFSVLKDFTSAGVTEKTVRRLGYIQPTKYGEENVTIWVMDDEKYASFVEFVNKPVFDGLRTPASAKELVTTLLQVAPDDALILTVDEYGVTSMSAGEAGSSMFVSKFTNIFSSHPA